MKISSLNIHFLEKTTNSVLYLLREDLLPYAMGGNKVRIALKLIEDAKHQNATCIIAYGNSRSNLCRVLSMLCIKEKIKCIIVSPSDDDGSRVETNNSLLASALGVEIIKTPKNASIQSVVETVINKQKLIGEKPYYIYGDSTGTGNEYIHMSAYVDVAKAIIEFEQQNNLIFDAICLAVGTGSTYAGLTMGLKLCQRDLPVVGFTIARPKERCETALNRFYDTFNLRHGTKFYINKQISDIALGDGYGKITQNQRTFLGEALKHYAIAFDETYVGKAFWGMYQEMYQGHLKGNVLFIHTGSLPLVFDALHKKEVN